MRFAALLVLFTGLSSNTVGASPPNYTHHQVYKTDSTRAIEAVHAALDELGLGSMGTDTTRGIVVSKAAEVEAKEVEDVAKFNQAARIVYFFVVFIGPREPNQVDVQVLTLLRARTPDKQLTEGGFYISGNRLSEKLFTSLERHLGSGLLVPLGG